MSDDSMALQDAWETFRTRYPLCAKGMLPAHPEMFEQVRDLAEDVWGRLVCKVQGDRDRLLRAIDALAETSMDFIRLHAQFRMTGRYRRQSSEGLVEDLYYDRDRMLGSYLDGLLLTYALWPNHARMLRFFIDEFLGNADADSGMLEIGVGHGLMTSLALPLVEGAYLGIDVSPSSLEYTRQMVEACQTGSDRLTLCEANVMDDGAWGGIRAQGPWGRIGCCEVLEHVDDPGRLLDRIVDGLSGAAAAFLTTCANIDAEDHVYQFRDVDHIRRMLADHGLAICRELVLPLMGMEREPLQPLNYAAIVVRGG